MKGSSKPSFGLLGRWVDTVTQQNRSQRFLSWRRASRDSSATKAVIWRMKSMSTARAAYRAKDFTAGMVDRAPWVAEQTQLEINALMIPSYILYAHRIVLQSTITLFMLFFCQTLKGIQKFLPKKKQTDSERLHRSMLGATFPRTRPICSSLFSPGLRTSLCKEGGGG